jgi:glycosyltransferase involved in cell wall biosynthesis
MLIVTQPFSAIIPTANRVVALHDTLNSLAKQNVQPSEIIIIDASDDPKTQLLFDGPITNLLSTIIYLKALKKGAAAQRNQGIGVAMYPFILFCDDDIIFEPFCLERLWSGITSDEKIGGVNAMITNQQYQKPGKVTAFMYMLLSNENLTTYAGKCIGPAWNLLPEDDDNLPEMVKAEWLNTTCTIYRKEALPVPAFSSHFQGYSMLEDLTLSSIVGRKWAVYNVRTARIFHDSQPGQHKKSLFDIVKMETVNRHYVMTNILNRRGFKYHCKFFLLELFFTSSTLTSVKGLKKLPSILGGKLAALQAIINKRKA